MKIMCNQKLKKARARAVYMYKTSPVPFPCYPVEGALVLAMSMYHQLLWESLVSGAENYHN